MVPRNAHGYSSEEKNSKVVIYDINTTTARCDAANLLKSNTAYMRLSVQKKDGTQIRAGLCREQGLFASHRRLRKGA